jgi:dTMP kinase
MRGKFIVLEGGEGVGKTTQLKHLQRVFELVQLPARALREPGGTEIGEILRPILKGYRYPEINEWHALCGYSFSRMAYIFDVVQPALKEGEWVLSDRFAFSTIVYQGYAGGLPPEVVQQVCNGVVGNHWPDLTFILDLPTEIGLARREAEVGDGTRYEDKGLAFHTKVREGYLNLLNDYPSTTVKIDATQTEAQVHHAILAELNQRFGLALQAVI